MSLVHYKPTSLFGQFDNELNRFFSDASAANQSRDWMPALDIREEQDRYILEADVPGVAREDLDISLDNSVLTIRGERTLKDEDESHEGYRRRERVYGSFVRQFTLPDTVNAEAISASIDNGVLKVGIPKQEKTAPKKISVE